MSVSFFVTLLVSLALCVLAGLVVIGPSEQKAKRSFAIMCVALGVWVMANYLADVAVEQSLIWTRLTFFAIVVASVCFTGFVNAFTFAAPSVTWRRVLFWGSSALTGVVIWLDAFIPKTEFVPGVSGANVVIGPLYPVFVVYFVGVVGLAIAHLIRRRKHLRGLGRQRVTFVLLAVAVMALIASVTNLFLPLITGVNPYSQLGTYSTLIFAGIISYAIVRHRLFSIRLVVARGLAYLFTLLTLGSAGIVIAFGVVDTLLPQASINESRLIYILVAIAAAFVYQPIKTFFDKITKRVFFSDLYDSREVLRELSDIAAHSLLPADMLRKSLKKLDEVVHPIFIQAYVRRSKTHEMIAVVGKRQDIDMDLLRNLPRRAVIITDEARFQTAQSGVVEKLQTNNVALIVRLETSGEHVGYLVFGYKLNGGAYNSLDISLLDTLADELAVAVQNALRFEEIARFNETLKQEIADATSQLRQSNNKLKKLDEAKDEFISMASHQLRTPLTSVKGYISMALEGDAGKLTPPQRKLLEEAFMSSQRMVYLIGDFLNVSRLQTGKFVIESKPVNLATLVQDEINQLVTTAQRRNITIEYHQPTHFPELMLDDNKMRQVIMNFIDNAIFYSKPDSKVLVALVATDKDVRLTVHDTGIGVPENERHHLFTKFYRAENARKARPDGTGIGLFMAKKVITAHGGSIIFESRENRGSTFGFSMPLHAKDHANQLEQKVGDQQNAPAN